MVRGSATSGRPACFPDGHAPEPSVVGRTRAWIATFRRDLAGRRRAVPGLPALLLAGLPRQGAGAVAFGLGLRLGGRKPIRIAGLEPPDGAEEGGLDLSRDGAHLAFADPPVVHFAHRGDLGRRSAHERLVGAVQVVAAEAALVDRDALSLAMRMIDSRVIPSRIPPATG